MTIFVCTVPTCYYLFFNRRFHHNYRAYAVEAGTPRLTSHNQHSVIIERRRTVESGDMGRTVKTSVAPMWRRQRPVAQSYLIREGLSRHQPHHHPPPPPPCAPFNLLYHHTTRLCKLSVATRFRLVHLGGHMKSARIMLYLMMRQSALVPMQKSVMGKRPFSCLRKLPPAHCNNQS